MTTATGIFSLLGGFVPMTLKIVRWIKATEVRTKADRAADAGDHEMATKWNDNAETVAHERRNRFGFAVAFWLAGLVTVNILWQYQTGGSLAPQIAVLVITGGVGGWIISLEQTGPIVDAALGGLLLLVNVGASWIVNSTAVLVYLAISAVGMVLTGATWRVLNPESEEPKAGAMPAEEPFGRTTEMKDRD